MAEDTSVTGATPEDAMRKPDNQNYRGALANVRVDMGDKQKRVTQQGARHLGKADFNNFYADLGFSTDAGTAKKIREEEAKYQENLGTAEGMLKQQAGQLGSSFDDFYKKQQKDWTAIKVINGDGVEATYRMPKSAAEEFMWKVREGYHTNYNKDDNTLYIDVRNKITGSARGQELHEGLIKAQEELRNAFQEKYGAQYATARGTFEGNKATLEEQKKQHDQTMKDAQEAYAYRIANLKKAFGG